MALLHKGYDHHHKPEKAHPIGEFVIVAKLGAM